MEIEIAIALAFGTVGLVVSILALWQAQKAKVDDAEARLIDRSVHRWEAFENIGGSQCVVEIQEYQLSHQIENNGDPKAYYYDFRHNRRREIEVARSKLGKFWKITIQMYRQGALSKNFFERGQWLRWGDEYRQLVEPLDVARYYREGFYVENGLQEYSEYRSDQHKFLCETWDKVRGDGEEVRDSMEWAIIKEQQLRSPNP